jgi:Domain of unknown function (DUF1963)
MPVMRFALKGLALIWVGVGVWLFVQKETGSLPLSAIALYTALWVAFALMIMAVAHFAQRNPFGRMKADERERAVEALLNVNASIEENTAKARALVRKYAPRHSEADQVGLLIAELREDLARGQLAAREMHKGPSVVLARQKRSQRFDVTREGLSWFGGLPTLGDVSWPRGADGRLMTPLAQIDLTGLAAHVRVPGLPNRGSLAFFASFSAGGEGSFAGTVRYVTGLADHLTQPDGPLPRVENYSFGGPLRRGEPAEGLVLFPRQAVELVPVTASGVELRAEVEEALGPAPTQQLSFGLATQAAPGPGQPYNRDSVMRFLHGARVALEAGREGLLNRRDTFRKEASLVADKLATTAEGRDGLTTKQDRLRMLLDEVDAQLALLEPAIPQLVSALAELEAWARTGDRWHPLTMQERAFLTEALSDWTQRDKAGWVALEHSYSSHRSLGDCVSETLLVMAVAEDAVFDNLPEALRDAINGPYRQPRRGVFHKMFGEPDSIQNAAWENQGSYMLLQLQCDDLAGFHWGDMGVMQFWITPGALKAGRWEDAYLTFEGN